MKTQFKKSVCEKVIFLRKSYIFNNTGDLSVVVIKRNPINFDRIIGGHIESFEQLTSDVPIGEEMIVETYDCGSSYLTLRLTEADPKKRKGIYYVCPMQLEGFPFKIEKRKKSSSGT